MTNPIQADSGEDGIAERPPFEFGVWHDMKFAPTDGTRVLVSMPAKPSQKGRIIPGRCGGVAIARWHIPDGNKHINVKKEFLSDMHGGFWTAHHKGTNPLPMKPNGWMPLPRPKRSGYRSNEPTSKDRE